MTPEQTREARKTLGLTLPQMATMLGYEGDYIRQMMHRIEIGERPLRGAQKRLIDAYLSGYRPDDWSIDLHNSSEEA